MAGATTHSGGRKSDKLWRDALMIAVKRTEGDDPRTLLARAAEECAKAAANGDIQAMKEIGDRIDGKPKQQMEHSGPDGESIPVGIRVEFVKPGEVS